MGDQNCIAKDKIPFYIDKIVANEKLSNVKYEVTAGSETGDNFVGVLHRILLTGESCNGQKTTKALIYKCQPDCEARRKTFLTDDFFKNEAVFYNNILPEFVKLQHEKVLEKSKMFTAFPTKCYHAGEVLILEDMRPSGFVMKDRRVPLDGAHCSLVMKEIAKFHAISFALQDQKPEEFKRMKDLVKEILFIPKDVDDMMLAHSNNYLDKAANEFMEASVVQDKERYVTKLRQFQDGYYKTMVEAVKGENAEPYAVINHGDCWSNNILFKYAKDSSVPEELCFLDFQLVRYSSPVTDLAYFIFCCTDQDTREKHYDNWMIEYHQSLSQFLKQLGSDPETLFPFSAFQDQIKRFSKYGVGMAILTIPLFTSKAEDLPDLNQMSEEATADNSQIDIASTLNKNDELCMKRMNGIIEDMVNRGYIP